MKAFFDTNVYINTFFRKLLPKEEFARIFEIYEIVLCPIVKHELLLGTIKEKTRGELQKFFDLCAEIEAPNKKIWQEATIFMKQLGWKENKQQNDVLIALSARRENATLITYDRHFEKLAEKIGFELLLLVE